MAKSQITNVADNPTVAAERSKLYELQAKLADAKAAVEAAHAHSDDSGRSAFDAAVDRELGKDVAAVALAPKLDAGEAMQRFRVLSVAVDRQAQIVRDAEQAAAVEIAKALRPQYAALLAKKKAAVETLRPILAAELAFRQRCYEGNVSLSTLGTCPLRGLSDAGIEGWLAELESKHAI